MKAVVVFDSRFGNTECVARAIAENLGIEETVIVAASEATAESLAGADLLVIGGPTHWLGLTAALKAFLARIPSGAVRNVPTVTFDTWLRGPRLIRGSAAAVAAGRLKGKGVRPVLPPASFMVTGMEGPLAEGELTRACTWGRTVRASAGLTARNPLTHEG